MENDRGQLRSDSDIELTSMPDNIDVATVRGFGFEWNRFDQSGLAEDELRACFDDYFAVFPWHLLPPGGGVGADIGCGTGRWSKLVAPKVAELHLVDPSEEALAVARRNLAEFSNVTFHVAGANRLPFEDESLDFAFSLGVLHHVPDTASAIKAIAVKLKPGAPLLLYLYYRLENRPLWYRFIWRLSDGARRWVCRLPVQARAAVTGAVAAVVYWPMARAVRALDRIGRLPANWPLTYYRDKSFYTMRTDALDRFGTRLEQRFTRAEIQKMVSDAGFDEIRFSDHAPFWCVSALKE